jgi:hypothetical protein
LVARRGFVVHPADWFPPKDATGLPDIYQPWLAWAEAADGQDTTTKTPDGMDGLLDATPSARLDLLKQWRQTDPAAARAGLAELFKGLAALHRANLLAAMTVNLGPDDAEFLTGLLRDRSGQVKKQANNLLARLGQAPGLADTTELAGFFQVTKQGVLRQRQVVRPLSMEYGAVRSRLRLLLDQVSLPQLAAALGLEADGLIEAWDASASKGQAASARNANLEFAQLVAASGSDEQVNALAVKLLQKGGDRAVAVSLLGRLSLELAARAVLANFDGPVETVEALAAASSADLIDQASLDRLIADSALVRDLSGGPGGQEGSPAAHRVAALATVMTAGAADAWLSQLEYQGVHRALPSVAALILNYELDDAARAAAVRPLASGVLGH